MIVLKPQDIFVLLKTITVKNPDWTYASLSNELFMSASEVHSAIKRSTIARLWDPIEKFPLKYALEEFIIHGLRYAFPANYSGVTRGIATAHAAPPLKGLIAQKNSSIFVWPDPIGQDQGMGLSPLYKTVTQATRNDNKLYEFLTLIDAIRIGSSRERKIAITKLKETLF